MERLVLRIEGMSCGHCLSTVRRVLTSVEGVEVRSVQIGKAELDAPVGGGEEIAALVTDAGYPTTVVRAG